jgi:filamentous hemagglutinin family protein
VVQYITGYNWQSDLIRLLTVSGVVSGAIATTAYGAVAQSITLDGTLGPAETLTGPTYHIPQSAGRTVGSNLFHSFGRFGLSANETAHFESNDAVRTILSRVTGGSQSTIDGLISTTSRNVNLFLINPSGIVFGPNARLNVGGANRGSFVATTTDALMWTNGGRFSAVNPGNADSLLTLVGDPSGFLAGLQSPGSIPGPIQSTASLNVAAGQSLVLLGGDVTIARGLLAASGGRVQVGAVEAGQVALNINNNALRLRFPDDSVQATVSFLNRARIAAPNSGPSPRFAPNSVEINGRTIALTDSMLLTANLEGSGSVTLDASDRVSLVDTRIVSDSLRGGNAGPITIRATNGVDLQGSILTATTFNTGTGGNIAIATDGDIRLTDRSTLTNQTLGAGNAGNISLSASGAVLVDDSAIASPSGALAGGPFGNAGNIDIQAGTLTLANDTRLTTTTTGAGQGGTIALGASNGPINITNSEVRTRTSGIGNAGDINVSSADSVTISGLTSSEFSSGLFTDTSGSGRAGNIAIATTNAFRLFDGAVLDARTTSSGAGGSIRLTADTVEIANAGRILTRTSASGNAGEIAIDATRNFNLAGNSVLTTETAGTGDAGNISVTADGAGLIDNSSISTSSRTSTSDQAGNAGDVGIQAGTLTLTNNAQLSTTTAGSGQGGDITLGILDGSLNIARSVVQTQTSGAGNAGSIAVNAADSVNISGITSAGSPGGLFTNTSDSGRAGDIAIATTNTFRLFDGAVLDARTTGSGAGGAIRLNANTVEITNGGQILTTTEGAGDAGNIAVNATSTTRLAGTGSTRATQSPRLAAESSRSRPTGLFASTESSSTGSGGGIAVNTGQLTVTADAQVTASSTGRGDAGGLDVTARRVDLSNQARLSAETATSQAGNIQLHIADSLVLRDRSQISAASTQTGQGGNITVNANQPAANSVQLIGGSRLSAQAEESSNAGSVNLNARRVVVQDGSEISASTESGRGGDIALRGLESLQVNNSRVAASTQTGRAGSVTVNAASSVQLNGRGSLSVEATQGGVAGNLTVNTDVLAIADGARATVSSPSGQAGNLTVTANTIHLDRGRLSAQTGVSQGESGANIRLRDLDQLVLRNRSRISADAGDRANGGNIGIDADFIVAVPSEDSDIRANAVEGRGGNILIQTQGLFGTQPAAESIPDTSDITASSERGVQGVVQITTPDVDPSQGLTELPADVVDASRLIARSCASGTAIAAPERSEFVMTGRGGVPLNPTESLGRDAVVSNWVVLNSPEHQARRAAMVRSLPEEPPLTAPIQEAQGWVVNANGEVVLVTQPPVATSSHPVFARTRCGRPLA